MFFTALVGYILTLCYAKASGAGIAFNATNFYVNSSCSMNDPFVRITVAGDPPGVSYQLFGSPDFLIHKHRGDIFMVRRPKDMFPLFYVSASDREGNTATAVVEVSHTCPTVSFDAVSYHFFALRRAPASVIGTLKASGRDIRYHTDSEIFQVNELTGEITARLILPIDATTIFYVKASDPSGNTDVAEIVVEVIGCYLDANSKHDLRYNVLFEKRCYNFAITSCEPGTVIGTIKAKGTPHPIYEYIDDSIGVQTYDGIITVRKALEPGSILHINILALNGASPDNRDYTYVSIDTRQCPAITTKKTTPTTTRSTSTKPSTTTTPIISKAPETSEASPNQTTKKMDFIPSSTSTQEPEFMPPVDFFDDINNNTVEEKPFNATDMDLEITFALLNVSFDDPFADVVTTTNITTSTEAITTMTPVTEYMETSTSKNGSFVFHLTARNRTVRPVHVQNPQAHRFFVKSNKPKNNGFLEQQGMEIV